MHRKRFVSAIFIILAVLGTAVFVSAQGEVENAPASTAPDGTFDLSQLTTSERSLYDYLQENDRALAVVSLAVPGYRPLSELRTSQRDAQFAAIGQTQRDVLSGLAAADYDLHRQYDYTPALSLFINANALRSLAANPMVANVQRDIPRPHALNSSLDVIKATGPGGSFEKGFQGAGWAVAILDTGVQFDHPMFSDGSGGNRVTHQACFNTTNAGNASTSFCPNGFDTDTTSPNAGQDCNETTAFGCEHGTHVAGIAAGNNRGHSVGQLYGVAPEADIIAVNVFSRFDASFCAGFGIFQDCVLAYTSDTIAGLDYVYSLSANFGVNVASANMSLGGGGTSSTCDSEPEKAPIDNLITEGVATVIASGNDGQTDGTSFPGCVSTAVTVSATDDSDNVANFSNVDSFVDLHAPGVNIVSSTVPNDYESYNGTSMATPHVAGAWAAMRQAYPSESVSQILARLQAAGPIVPDQRGGAPHDNIPRLNIGDAINVAPPTQELLQNGDFSNGLNFWATFGDINATLFNDGVNFHRQNPGWGGATVFQAVNTVDLNAGEPVVASVDLQNLSFVPKGVEVVFRTQNFSEQIACSVTLPPQSGVQTITMRDVLSTNWSDALFAVRALDPDGTPNIRMDNASVQYLEGNTDITGYSCSGDVTSNYENLLNNGNFSNGLRYWIMYGDYSFAINNGILTFYRTNSATRPAVALNNGGHYIPTGSKLRFQVRIGNTSNVAKQVNVVVRDQYWSQQISCNYTVPANTSMTTVTVKGTAVKNWANPMVLVRNLSADGAPNLLVDDGNLQIRPVMTIDSNCGNPFGGATVTDGAKAPATILPDGGIMPDTNGAAPAPVSPPNPGGLPEIPGF